tara:strand:- start:322 stop:543 length:222 start_codon:yes stop_codon:yes gene_type:complete
MLMMTLKWQKKKSMRQVNYQFLLLSLELAKSNLSEFPNLVTVEDQQKKIEDVTILTLISKTTNMTIMVFAALS